MDFLLQLNWLAVSQIILIDLLLGGDNAVVIALACRNLPPALRTKGIIWGTVGAVVLRILLIAVAVTILGVPYLKLAGGVMLLWIGVKLLAQDDDAHGEVKGSDRLLAAIKTIIVADLVMSIDNVVAVASAAEHADGDNDLMLVVFGIAVSIPIIVWGSTLVMRLMDKVPAIVTMGAGLLGYLGGAMMATDVSLQRWAGDAAHPWSVPLPGFGVDVSVPGAIGALLVVMLGQWLRRRRMLARELPDNQDR